MWGKRGWKKEEGGRLREREGEREGRDKREWMTDAFWLQCCPVIIRVAKLFHWQIRAEKRGCSTGMARRGRNENERLEDVVRNKRGEESKKYLGCKKEG